MLSQCFWKHVLCETDGESEHIVGGRERGKGERTLHVMGTFVTQGGSV